MAKTHRYSTLLTWTGAARGPTANYAGYSREFDAQIAGKPTFNAIRRRDAEHPIEEVGARLRAMMPWITKNKLVDQARN